MREKTVGEKVMRAKVQVGFVQQHGSFEVVQFNAVAANKYPADGADENNTYAKFSPQASFNITIANPSLHGAFAPGDTFYADFTRAPK